LTSLIPSLHKNLPHLGSNYSRNRGRDFSMVGIGIKNAENMPRKNINI
jgi:hypothetical protein